MNRIKHLFNRTLTHQGFRRYFANTSWMFAEQVLRLFAGLLVGIWVARYLGPEQFGLFSYAIAFATIFSSISKLGLDGIVVRNLVREPNQRDIYLGTAFWLKLSGAVLTLAAITLAIQFTSNDQTTNLYILIIASGTIFQSFEVVNFYFQSQVLSKFVSICKLTQLLLSSVLKLYLIFSGADLIWFVLVSLFDQVTLAASLYLAYRYQKIGDFYHHYDFSIAKQLLKDSWPLILSGFVVLIYMRIDQIMIKEILGEREVGLYTVAVRLSELWYFIPIIITNSVFPSIINTKEVNKVLYQTRMRRLYTLMIWTAVAIAIPMTLLSDWLIKVLFGENYSEAGQVLTINIWAGIFVFIGVASGHWLLNENLQKYSTINTTIGAVSNVLLNMFLIPCYGISGAAFSTLLSYAIAAYFMNFAFQKTRENFVRISKAIINYK